MLKNSLSFNQSSSSLKITGLPDYSKGDDQDSISIISSWSLEIIGKPSIEGKSDHLIKIISAFYSYSSSILSSICDSPKIINDLIEINRGKDGTNLVLLKSTKKEFEDLELHLSDPEFSDVIYCFDNLLNDKKTKFSFDIKDYIYLTKYRRILDKDISYSKFLAPPFIAIIIFLALTSVLSNNQNNIRKNSNSFINTLTISYFT
tara:strand:- start:14861 stop:15472 length:612 start_codon:yes stop_codon:yes gene_type:complete